MLLLPAAVVPAEAEWPCLAVHVVVDVVANLMAAVVVEPYVDELVEVP